VDNLLGAPGIGHLLLDENLEVRRFSPQMTRIFKLLDTDIGRPITHISHYLTSGNPLQALRDVQATNQPLEREVRTREERWYLMRAVPYIVGPKSFSGAVLSFVDITHYKQLQRTLPQRESSAGGEVG
ncbi:MAG: PAS domain-containing protein, partial [Candidatus Competibacter sp.]|nr:PAS domain-containing protein [Candidatus Competibacter sp.]